MAISERVTSIAERLKHVSLCDQTSEKNERAGRPISLSGSMTIRYSKQGRQLREPLEEGGWIRQRRASMNEKVVRASTASHVDNMTAGLGAALFHGGGCGP